MHSFGTRAAVESGEDIPDVHIDSARAEDKRLRNFLVRPAERDLAHDFKLAAGETPSRVSGG